MKNWFYYRLFRLGVWCLSKAFPYVMIKMDGDDEDVVKAVVFAVDEETLKMYDARVGMRGV